jgi:hypothetical protein
LPLFVARIAAHDVHRALTTHNLAVFADTLNAGSHLHNPPSPPDLMTTLAKASEYSELDRKLTSPSYHNLECDDFHRNWRVFLQGVRAKKKVMENILAVQRSASRRG